MTTTFIYHFVVGDIHGCLEQLTRLEKKARAYAKKHNARPFFISCGDLVDRGPESKQVLEHFHKGLRLGTHAFVLGNHEIMMLEVLEAYRPDLFRELKRPVWFRSLRDLYENELDTAPDLSFSEFRDDYRATWLRQGGRETLQSFQADPQNPKTWNVDGRLIHMLFSAPFMLELPRDFGVVSITHALPSAEAIHLYREIRQPASLNQENLKRWHEALDVLIWNRELIAPAPLEGELWVSGHTPGDGIRRSLDRRILQIDTGCSVGGALTAWCMEQDRFFRTWPKTE